MSFVGLETMLAAAKVTLLPWLSLEKKQVLSFTVFLQCAIGETQGRTDRQAGRFR
jgi:hypothetical protein